MIAANIPFASTSAQGTLQNLVINVEAGGAGGPRRIDLIGQGGSFIGASAGAATSNKTPAPKAPHHEVAHQLPFCFS
jgi:hypothetical protein